MSRANRSRTFQDAQVYTWGEFHDRLTSPHELSDTLNMSIMQAVSNRNVHFILDKSGRLFVQGGSEAGLLGLGRDVKHVTQLRMVGEPQNLLFKSIVVGSNHAIAISIEDEIYAWGENTNGQCGVGGIDLNLYIPMKISFGDPLEFKQILALDDSSFAVTSAGAIFTWGDNTTGILGLGSKKTEFTPQKIPRISGISELLVNVSLFQNRKGEWEKVNIMTAVKGTRRARTGMPGMTGESASMTLPSEQSTLIQTTQTFHQASNHSRQPSTPSSDTGSLSKFKSLARKRTSVSGPAGVTPLGGAFFNERIEVLQDHLDHYDKSLDNVLVIYQDMCDMDNEIYGRVYDETMEKKGKRVNIREATEKLWELMDRIVYLNRKLEKRFNTGSLEISRFQRIIRMLRD